MRERPPFASLLSLGWLLGSALGAAAGIAECALAPLGEPARIPYVLGADALFGGVWGVVAAGIVAALAGIAAAARSRSGAGTGPGDGVPPAATGSPRASGTTVGVAALVLFLPLGAALGLFVNRVALSGTHFLSPLSLALDALALVAAGILARVAGARIAHRIAASRFAAQLSGPRGRFPDSTAGVGSLVLPVVGTLAAIALLVFGPPRLLARGSAPPDLPPIVLVSIDTLRPDRLSGGGDPRPTSPEVDRLVREGTLFPNAIAASPGSAASHAALLTSRYPISNGVWANFSVMDTSVVTLAEILKARGYRTGGFVTNTFLGRRFHFDQGFDAYVESGMVERLSEPSGASLFRSLALVQIADRLRGRLRPGYDPSFETALRWIGESETPAFFFVHLMDVHSPYVPPHPYGPRFGADRSGGRGEGARNRFGWRPSEEAYVAEIRFVDHKIGRLRKKLEELGLLDEAIVILTSDHGENMTDHEPHFSHGATLFDATLRILASVRAPGRLEAGTLRPAPLENVDLLPTLSDVLGWERHEDWEGTSLAGAPPRPRVLYAQLNRDFAARGPDWKMMIAESGERTRYDLREDPGETRPLEPGPEHIAEVETGFTLWFDRFATALYLEAARTIRPEDLSPELVEKLEALGYIQ